MDEELDWARVAREVDGRLDELGLSQIELARRSSVSPITIRRLQAGTGSSYRRATLAAISTALGWRPDGISRISRGFQPIESEADAASPATALGRDRLTPEEAIEADETIPDDVKPALLDLLRGLRRERAIPDPRGPRSG